jgi:hypothetical protein
MKEAAGPRLGLARRCVGHSGVSSERRTERDIAMIKHLFATAAAAAMLTLPGSMLVGVGSSEATTICNGGCSSIHPHTSSQASGGSNCVVFCGLPEPDADPKPAKAALAPCPPDDASDDNGSPAQVVHFGKIPNDKVGANCYTLPSAGSSRVPGAIDPDGPGSSGDPGGLLKPFKPKRPAVVVNARAAIQDCDSQLVHLRDVSEREIRSVDGGDRVRLIPICDSMQQSLTSEVHTSLAGHGNAASLIPAIARNRTLQASLSRARYRADDVVGVVMATDTVMLYVHKQ